MDFVDIYVVDMDLVDVDMVDVDMMEYIVWIFDFRTIYLV